MKIQTKSGLHLSDVYESFEELAKERMDDSQYVSGQFEILERNTNNLIAAFGRLLDRLADKGILDCDDCVDIIDPDGEDCEPATDNGLVCQVCFKRGADMQNDDGVYLCHKCNSK